MVLRRYAGRLKRRIGLLSLKVGNLRKERFTCPVCNYRGPFMDLAASTGVRKHAKCPNCGALERHRIQFLVLNQILSRINTANIKMLHFAPEPCFREFFSKRFKQYESADLTMEGVNHNVDLRKLPFGDETYDFVFASHVLEHIIDDRKALCEIRRILRPGGIAVLPVPILAEKTIEYPEPNPHESYHVRAPGTDYFERYKDHFSRVELFDSLSLPEEYQLFEYEDRSNWPTKECPLRLPMQGERHIDIVPVCYV
jgi:SAM-dependent methyltransferase